jgi:glycosyltransferase involved in cell wall biosynthesis
MASVSVVIPVYNSAAQLKLCLDALVRARNYLRDIIVVDDGSTDDTPTIAAKYPVTFLSTGGRRGPAYARNMGAKAASSEVVLFLDSDVCVHDTTIAAICSSFDNDPELDALIGSYDDQPQAPDFISQYRNLMHSFVHHQGARRASTFWSGCGAIRRSLFLEHAGFNERYERPAIEDIELGYRLVRSGRKIILDRQLEVQHLKRWTFWNVVRTDVRDRGIPWTELILRYRLMPNDLNLQFRQRISVALVFVLIALFGFMAFSGRSHFLIPLFAMLFVMLARYWSEFPDPGHPRAAVAVMVCAGFSIVALAWSHGMFLLIPPVVMSPVMLLLRQRYAAARPRRKLVRPAAVAYIVCSAVIAAVYLPVDPLALVCFAILGVLGVMNSQFYLYLAGKRGLPFMLAAFPFHLLYHFYNGISFAMGLTHHLWRTATNRQHLPVADADTLAGALPYGRSADERVATRGAGQR